MLRSFVKKESNLAKIPYSHEIINDDGSLFEITKPAGRPINGLDTIAGDLDAAGATIKARLDDKKELDAKFAELKELIRQTRHEMEQKTGVIKKAEQ
jgi:hypothetical protein